jgi:streptomycin 6-kinase
MLLTGRCETIIRRDHPDADRWIAGLSSAVADLCERWQLDVQGPLEGGVRSCVLACTDRRGRPVVLKIPVRAADNTLEVAALRAMRPVVPDVLRASDRAVLLSRVSPGVSLRQLPATEAVLETVIWTLNLIHTEHAGPWTALDTHVNSMIRDASRWEPFADLRTNVNLVAGQLLSASVRQTLLHGDLHAGNALLDDQQRIVLIDPSGLFGDPVFDLAYWTVKYPSRRDLPERIIVMSELAGVPAERIAAWCFVICATEGAVGLARENSRRAQREWQQAQRLAEFI